MKLKHALIRNFKGVRELSIDFTRSYSPDLRPLTLLVGDNGSGKTSVLQAIALTLSLATKRTASPAEFNWRGFLPERVSSLGPSEVHLHVCFDEEELQLTADLHREWERGLTPEEKRAYGPDGIVQPGRRREVTLVLESGVVSSPQGEEALAQFMGRGYLKQLCKRDRSKRSLFVKLGDVFWFDQYRDIGTVGASAREETGANWPESRTASWLAGLQRLRNSLVTWWAYSTTSGAATPKDNLAQLQEGLRRLLPGTELAGVAPGEEWSGTEVQESYVWLRRDGHEYDLAEMSSGEQALFALLYDFVRLDIAKSVVLIDELELHLHPPEQQALLSAIRQMGGECQFLVTTHSVAVADVVPNEHTVRLPGGRRCL